MKVERVIKRKGNKLYVNWKDYNNSFNSFIDKKDIVIWKITYFPEPHSNNNKIEVELDFSNYARISDFW